jgi:type I site-specific restriction endonuclease
MPTKRMGRPRKHSKNGSSNLDKYTALKETSTRKKVDLWLTNLGWNTDEESQNCNVTTERALTHEQKQKLKGKEPDYFLYKSETKEIIAPIETKAKGENLDQALKDSIKKYAEPLEVPLFSSLMVHFSERGIERTASSYFLTENPLINF